MSRFNLTLEQKIDGWRIFDGDLLLGNLSTRQFRGVVVAGSYRWEPLPRENWAIHWTSPQTNLDMFAEVLTLVHQIEVIEKASQSTVTVS